MADASDNDRTADTSGNDRTADASGNAILYTAVYDDVNLAQADLAAFEELHKLEMIGKYDAAVIDKEDGNPHIVKRADRPMVRVIPEWFGSGPLPRKELHEAAQALDADESALVVVAEPTLEKGLQRAIARATRTVQHGLDKATKELEKELSESVKK
jgi:hypothetical protein